MQKRVVIIDFNHQAHTYFFSRFRLSVRVNGEDKDTTVQTNTMKNLYRWSHKGSFPTAVCFDRPVPARKMYFQSNFPDMAIGGKGEYKGGRAKMPEDLFNAISECESLMRRAGVSVFSKEGYEADDLIYACVKHAKNQYPGMPIDIVTNDADLLPLVDETVSVFLRSKKGTYAEDSSIEKNKYIQVTPRNFQSVVEDLSDYKGFVMPYNSLLLHKLLRGDNSDNYKRKDISKLFPATKWNAMMDCMLRDKVNFEEAFRYGDPVREIRYNDTNKLFEGSLEDALKSSDKGNLHIKLNNSEELDCILDLLRDYTVMDEGMLDHIAKMYNGVNLNQPYGCDDPRYRRVAYNVAKSDIGGIYPFSEVELQKALTPLQIKIIQK